MYFKRVALFLLLACCSSCLAISEGEQLAVSAMIKAWPVLTNLTPAWDPNQVARACLVPFQGLQCTTFPKQAIIGLYVRFLSILRGPLLFPTFLPPMPLLVLATDFDFCLNLSDLRRLALNGTIPDEIGNLEGLTSMCVYLAIFQLCTTLILVTHH